MARLILQLSSGADAASVQSTVSGLPMVQDAQPAAQANAVLVTVDQVNQSVRDDLANQPGVTGVFDDLQGIPLVAREDEVQDF